MGRDGVNMQRTFFGEQLSRVARDWSHRRGEETRRDAKAPAAGERGGEIGSVLESVYEAR